MVLKRRHIAKAITWRLCSTTVTIAIAIVVTGDVKMGLIMGPLDIVIKLGLYYWHEKMWINYKFGLSTAYDPRDLS